MTGGSRTAPLYWGWSPDNARMEMMDLATYLGALRTGYEEAMDELQAGWQALSGTFTGAPQAYGWTGSGRRAATYPDGHGHDEASRRRGPCAVRARCPHCGQWGACGECCPCGHDSCEPPGCTCDCCITSDADVVIYARCGELRLVPIELANDTRRAREDVVLEVGDVRSAGGRLLPWEASVDPEGPLTLEPCSRTTVHLTVGVRCGDPQRSEAAPPDERPRGQARGARTADVAEREAPANAEAGARTRPDVDSCVVGYVTVKANGCLIRPIVIAIAVLPRFCDPYRAGCGCSCCGAPHTRY